MNDMHANRLAAVRRRMEEMGLSSLLVSEPATLWYLTGETIHPGERLTVLLVPAKGSALWIRNRLFPLAKGMDLLRRRRKKQVYRQIFPLKTEKTVWPSSPATCRKGP